MKQNEKFIVFLTKGQVLCLNYNIRPGNSERFNLEMSFKLYINNKNMYIYICNTILLFFCLVDEGLGKLHFDSHRHTIFVNS